MYNVAFRRDAFPFDQTILHTGFADLNDAKNARQCNGDIIVFAENGKVVTDQVWWNEDDSYVKNLISNPLLERNETERMEWEAIQEYNQALDIIFANYQESVDNLRYADSNEDVTSLREECEYWMLMMSLANDNF